MKTTFFLSLFAMTTLFAQVITIDNQTPYPSSKDNTTIGIQWASSSPEMEKKSADHSYQSEGSPEFTIQKNGKTKVTVPDNAKYFCVGVWQNNDSSPTYVTSWVKIKPKHVYTIRKEDLYRSNITGGSGC